MVDVNTTRIIYIEAKCEWVDLSNYLFDHHIETVPGLPVKESPKCGIYLYYEDAERVVAYLKGLLPEGKKICPCCHYTNRRIYGVPCLCCNGLGYTDEK
jgi:hypothetical protein